MERLLPLGSGIYIYVSQVHRFGTDAVLLADFARPGKKDAVCDLGTGCGIIPLLWCRGDAPESITAVDIQPDACGLFQRSILKNGLSDRIRAVCADLRDPAAVSGPFDLVTMNPPYKASGDGKKSDNTGRRIARHDDTCTLRDLAECASRILRFGGRLCLCQRPERLCDAVDSLRRAGIEPKRLRMVCQRVSGAPKLMLLEGKKGAKAGLTVLPSLIIEGADGGYSEEMKKIYAAYADGHKTEESE